jgi:hypothetical protein
MYAHRLRPARKRFFYPRVVEVRAMRRLAMVKVEVAVSLPCLCGLVMQVASAHTEDFYFMITGDMRDQHATFGRVVRCTRNW